MTEIRRIRAGEAAVVTDLWDEMARSADDGGPLSERGRRNITAMLAAAADHEEVFCLVAENDGELIAFTVGRTVRDPLLPGVGGEIEEFYVTPPARASGLSRALADAAMEQLRAMGAGIIWHHVCRDDNAAQGFWQHLGFEGDTIRFALYPA